MGEELDRPPLLWDLASAIARAGVDPSAPHSPLVAALRGMIADRRGSYRAAGTSAA